jgi:hypothetical protein
MFGGYLILLLTPGYVFLKKIKIKKPPTLGIWKIKITKSLVLVISKISKNHQVS